VRDKNCLGRNERDNGHKREPEPPDKITGTIKLEGVIIE